MTKGKIPPYSLLVYPTTSDQELALGCSLAIAQQLQAHPALETWPIL